MPLRRFLGIVAAASLIALIGVCLAWELWLAPLRPGGSLVALKALPLCLPLKGILEEKRYTYQWSSLLILAYFAEGATRAYAERGTSQVLALSEVVLSLVFFAAAPSPREGAVPGASAPSGPAGRKIQFWPAAKHSGGWRYDQRAPGQGACSHHGI